jgi:hypothetical protein
VHYLARPFVVIVVIVEEHRNGIILHKDALLALAAIVIKIKELDMVNGLERSHVVIGFLGITLSQTIDIRRFAMNLQ